MNVMKQFDFLVLLIGSIACFSCSDDISTCENSFKNNSCQDQGEIEIALPNKPKDIIRYLMVCSSQNVIVFIF